MMLHTKLIGCALPLVTVLVPQTSGEPPAQDVETIEQLSGCFQVTYRFAEDGEHDLFSPEYGLEDPVTEWISFERRGENTFGQIHVAIREGGRPMPHFEEIWEYLPDDGRWKHEIWGTPGTPNHERRYACEGTWEMNRWHCPAGRAEKPFRDSGAPFGFDRDDYDYLDRTNTLLVTPEGWVHKQDNRKMTEDGELVSYELGWITYERVEDTMCGEAPGQFPN